MTTHPVDLYPKIAEKFGISVDLVKEIVDFFYKDGLKNDKANFASNEIYVAGLGSFEVKEFKVKHFLRNLTAKIETEEKYQSEKFKIIQDNLIRIINQIEDIKTKKKEFNEFYRQTSRDIPEQEENLGRIEEQDVQERTRRDSIQ